MIDVKEIVKPQEFEPIAVADTVMRIKKDRLPPDRSNDSGERLKLAWYTYAVSKEAIEPETKAWVEAIGRACMAHSSPAGIRSHKLYKQMLKVSKRSALRGAFHALRTAPIAAIVIASDILGADGPTVEDEDRLDLDLLVDKWEKWGRLKNYLPTT